MKKINLNNVYQSGLPIEDWYILHSIILPFVHAKNPSKIKIPKLPEHLKKHKLVIYLKKYQKTNKDLYLDRAAWCLFPISKVKEKFGWYLALTKM